MVPNVVPGSPFSTPPGTTTGPNFFLMPKLVHLGSTGNKFDDKLIKNRNFQKMVPNVVPGTPFRTPPGTQTDPNVLSMPKLIHLDSFATNFGDEIIKNLSFQKMVPNVVSGTFFRTPPGSRDP